MKKRRHKRGRKRVYKTAPPGFPVAIYIHKQWTNKEDNSPVDFGEILSACMFNLGLQDNQGYFPFTLHEPDDENRTAYLQVSGIQALGDFRVVQVVDSDSEEAQQLIKVTEIFKDVALNSGQYSESWVEEAIKELVVDGDKVRVPLITCAAGEDHISRMVMEEHYDINHWKDLRPLPIGTLQQIFDDFLGYLFNETVIDGTSNPDMSLSGDRRWLVQGGGFDKFMQRWDASRIETV